MAAVLSRATRPLIGETMNIHDELHNVIRLRGDTYSSAEVLGILGRAKDEIERLRALLRRTAAVLAAATAGTRCSIAAGDLYRDIIAAKIISDEQSVEGKE